MLIATKKEYKSVFLEQRSLVSVFEIIAQIRLARVI